MIAGAFVGSIVAVARFAAVPPTKVSAMVFIEASKVRIRL
jgi:hypothetical protein